MSMEDNMKVELASCGNPDHFQDPDHPMYGCESNRYVTVKTLEEASTVCRKFIENNFLGGGNWAGGRVYDRSKHIARISCTGKILPPEDQNNDLTEENKKLSAVGIGDVPAWLEYEGLELAKAYFEENCLDAYTCYITVQSNNNSELAYHWIMAEKEANKILADDSRYDNSCIYLVFSNPDE